MPPLTCLISSSIIPFPSETPEKRKRMSSPVQIPRRKRTALKAPAMARERRLRRLRRLVDFGNKVKLRFPHRRDVFAAFCETCSLCEEKGEEWVFGTLRDLFVDHQDLIAAFVELQSEGSTPLGGARGSAGHEAFSGLGNELAVLNTGEKPEKPKGSFREPVKNAHQRVLFEWEDHMCNLDVTIELARSAISHIGRHLAAGRRDGCRLMPGELRCIKTMYGKQGAEMLELLREDPARTLPLVLSRLQQKHDEWMACRSDYREVCKKAFAKHHQPSLGRGDTSTVDVEAPGAAGTSSASCPPAEAKVEAPENIGANVCLNLFSTSQCRLTGLMIESFYETTSPKP